MTSESLAPFVARHIGPGDRDLDRMLTTIGASSVDDLVARAVPQTIAQKTPLGLEAAASESTVLTELREKASRNRVLTSMIGLGYYGTHTPGVIKRNILENPAWYTAYTPYQPEISQGRLEALLNFQTVVTDLTGLATAGSSLLDEATANLDLSTEARVSQAMGVAAHGRTALVIAHRLSTAVTADKIVVMDQGRVAEVGTHTDLLARGGTYTALWEAFTGAPTVAH